MTAPSILRVRAAWRKAITNGQRREDARRLAEFRTITDTELARLYAASTDAEQAMRDAHDDEQARLREQAELRDIAERAYRNQETLRLALVRQRRAYLDATPEPLNDNPVDAMREARTGLVDLLTATNSSPTCSSDAGPASDSHQEEQS